MTDERRPPAIAVTVPPDQEVGVFADFAGIWHTPTTFVLDFMSLTAPGPQLQQVDEVGDVVGALPAKVAARVRIPAEQVFQIVAALQQQAEQWLTETGRPEPRRRGCLTRDRGVTGSNLHRTWSPALGNV